MKGRLWSGSPGKGDPSFPKADVCHLVSVRGRAMTPAPKSHGAEVSAESQFPVDSGVVSASQVSVQLP